MARPKKAPFTACEAAGVAAFHHINGDPLPSRVDVLQEAICAVLNRFRSTDPETVRLVVLFLKILAARCCGRFFLGGRVGEGSLLRHISPGIEFSMGFLSTQARR